MKETMPFQFSVNGIQRDFPLSNEPSFGDLLEFVRKSVSTDACCVASIRVDGTEITENEEIAYAPLPLAELRSVEIFTAHPRELAEETLQNMSEFTEPLISLCLNAGEKFKSGGHPSQELARLIDGIETFVEALTGAKMILRMTQVSPKVTLLETDLASIMKDLLEFYQQNQTEYVVDLLLNHLPQNIAEWKSEGIPTLIRSRDS